ncbi:hypothetical protein TNCV_2596951 [Trichonephila clavipes]|nr:hypothetical protein TNCV_2596951 [Trichonephila clavipes]
MALRKGLSTDGIAILLREISENNSDGGKLSYCNLDSNEVIKLSEKECEEFEKSADAIDNIPVLDESRSFFRVHTGYFSNIPKCIKAEFIASWGCSQSSVVSSSQR